MESAIFVVERLSTLSNSFFSGAQSAEIFSCFWNDIAVKLKNNTSRSLVTNGNVKKNIRASHFIIELKILLKTDINFFLKTKERFKKKKILLSYSKN